MNEKAPEHVVHTFAPVYDSNSRILILGSLPSVKSRQNGFYYGHPQNRFWRVLAAVFGRELPQTIEEKTSFLHDNRIALWDVVHSCDIIDSSDSSIKNVLPNKLELIFSAAKIEKVFANGATAFSLYKKFDEKLYGIKAQKMPSTSPANAVWTLERLIEEWQKILSP